MFLGSSLQQKLLGLLCLCSPLFPIGIWIFYRSWKQSSARLECAKELYDNASGVKPLWGGVVPMGPNALLALTHHLTPASSCIVIGSASIQGTARLAEAFTLLLNPSDPSLREATSTKIQTYFREQEIPADTWVPLPASLNAPTDLRVARITVRSDLLTIHPEIGFWGYFMVPETDGMTVHVPGGVILGQENIIWGNWLSELRDSLWPLAEEVLRLNAEDAPAKIEELDELYSSLDLANKSRSEAYQREYTGAWIALAVVAGHAEALREILERGGSIDASIPEDEYLGIPEFLSPLSLAARHGQLEIAQLLIASGADVHATEPLHNFSALYLSVAFEHTEVTKYLLSQGADPNVATHEGSTALLLAVDNENLKVTDMLLNAKADPNQGFEGERCSEEHRGLTPVVMAASSGHSGILKSLARAGADVDAEISTGINALLCAVLRGQYEAVQALVMAGVDVNSVKDSEKERPYTALDLAKDSGNADIASYLERHGAVSAK
jgi:ankyrin repeat protein